MLKFVHLFPDDKFVDFFCELCEHQFPKESKYFVCSCDNTLKYIKRSDLVKHISPDAAGLEDILNSVSTCGLLIIHFLTDFGIRLVNRIPYHATLVWSGWGADYYNRIPNFEDWAYHDQTKAFLAKLYPHQQHNKMEGSLKTEQLDLPLRKAIGRVDYFSAPIPDDYELMKNAFPWFKAKYIQLNYGSVESTFQPGALCIRGKNILVGNSATPTNNHLEVFNMLQSIELDDSKIFVPLSYGGLNYLTYRENLINEATDILGKHFSPLINFIPLEEYNRTISSCGIAIMNHRRQQALGNIGMMMYNGAKLFLNREGPVYNFFQKLGAHIYAVDQINYGKDFLFEPLTKVQISNNRAILEDFWGHANVENNLRHIAKLTCSPLARLRSILKIFS